MHAVTVCQSAISQSIGGICCDGFLKAFNTLVNPVLGSFVRPVAALQIASVGFGTSGIGLGEALLFLPCQTQPERLGDFLGYFFLEGEDVRRLTTVLLAPDVAAVSRRTSSPSRKKSPRKSPRRSGCV